MRKSPDIAISGIASMQDYVVFVDTMLSTASSRSSHMGKVIRPKICWKLLRDQIYSNLSAVKNQTGCKTSNETIKPEIIL